MLTKEEFARFSLTNQLWVIYDSLPKSTAQGESPIAGIFDKTETGTPNIKYRLIPPNKPLPPGFAEVFGQFPNVPFGSGEREVYENLIKSWGGLYDLAQLSDYEKKVSIAAENGLGTPIAFVLSGVVFVTFSIFGQDLYKWKRDLSQYMDHYQDMVNVANLEARQKGLL